MALYNLGVRTGAIILLTLTLAACNRGAKNTEAVRQGVVDHLSKSGFNTQVMDVNVLSADIKGNQADATVSIGLKGNPSQGLSRKYHLELQGSQWVVTGSQDAGTNPHGGKGAAPGMENPHGGGTPSPGGAPAPGGGTMPSPEDLPPVKKK